jgi:tRNA (guanine37-N1)-methyltransferase
MDSLCVVVPKKKAEPVRKKLAEKGFLRKDLQIKSDAKNVFLPVIQRVDLGFPVETADFKEVEEAVKDYRVLVDAIVKMADEVVPYAKDIGKAIIATQKAIRTVCVDSGVVDQFRTRNIKVVAGDKATETTHKEYGLVFKMDISKVFFSPRLSTEREVVARQVNPGEVVIDMFAGIGPFSIMIAKNRAPKVVYAIDINPEAIGYRKENIALNKVGNVISIQGDAREEIVKLEKADRVIMNLPHDAKGFIPDAIRALKPGGIVHFYEIMEESDVQARISEIADVAVREGRVMRELARRKVKSYSPTMNFYAFDLQFL